MNLPDPDDPDFQAELREAGIWLFGGFCILLGLACLVIACLSP